VGLDGITGERRGGGVFLRRLLLSSVALVPLATAMAQPTGPTVRAGQASVATPSTTSTIVTQTSTKAIINWQDFSVAANGSVQFIQPDASSITLNRVVGGSLSTIDGAIRANGQVWLINPNGVLFGQGSTVHVAGLLATSADIADGDFLSGNYNFSGSGNASVVNNGKIQAAKGGSVVLSAPHVANGGLIAADAGHVVLGGADTFTVDFNGDHLLSYAVTTPSNSSASAVNSGTIRAPGGKVLLTARAAAGVADGVVSNSGTIEATSAHVENGEVVLDAGDGTASDDGTVDVSGKAAGQTGGTVEITGAKVAVGDGAKIDASGDAGGGQVSIGGNLHGAGQLRNAQTTSVGNAVITADAVTSGNGGTVAVWSNGSTTFAGAVSAKGGARGGNGGQVETSGHTVQVSDQASVTTLAPAGAAGDWLLDPQNIDIAGGGRDPETGQTFGTNAGVTVTIDPTAIESALSSGNLTLQADTDIMVSSDVTVTAATTNTLTLQAGRSIILGGGSLNYSTGNIVLSANDPGAATGDRVPGAASLTSGSFSVAAANVTLELHSDGSDGGSIGTSAASFNVPGGALSVTTSGASAFLTATLPGGAQQLTIGNGGINTGVGNLTLSGSAIIQNPGSPIITNILTVAATGGNISLNAANQVTGYAIFNSTGDTGYTNTVNTFLGGPDFPTGAPNGYTPPTSVVGGNLDVEVNDANQTGGNHSLLVMTGRVDATGSGVTILHATGDIDNNSGDGTIIAANMSLVSDFGAVGGNDGTDWSFGLGANSGVLNLHASAATGIVINPGDVNFGVTGIAGGLSGTSVLMFGNGVVTQNSDSSGVINTGSLDIHALSTVSLTNANNVVTGEVDFRAPDDISFTNSVSTLLGRANSGNLDANNNPVPAGNVTIIVHDPSGATNPTLTLGNSIDTDVNNVDHVTSIEASGLVTLQADGNISDGYDAADSGTFASAGHVIGVGLTATSSNGAISLTNPANQIASSVIVGTDPNGAPTETPSNPITLTGVGHVAFTNSGETVLGGVTVSAASGNVGTLDIEALDAPGANTHSDLILTTAVNVAGVGDTTLHATGNIINMDGDAQITADALNLISDFGSAAGPEPDDPSTTFFLGATINSLHVVTNGGGIDPDNPGTPISGGLLISSSTGFSVGTDQGGISTGTGGGLIAVSNGDPITQGTSAQDGIVTTGNFGISAGTGGAFLNNPANQVTGLGIFTPGPASFTNSGDTQITQISGSLFDNNVSSAGAVTLTINDGTLTEQNSAIVIKTGNFTASTVDTAYAACTTGCGTPIAYDILLDGTANAISGGISLGSTGNIELDNSVDTLVLRANGGLVDKSNNLIPAANIAIEVDDSSGLTTPGLTLGNATITDHNNVAHVTSLEATGIVETNIDGAVSDGYNPADSSSFAGAGHVIAGGEAAIRSIDSTVALNNPANSFPILASETTNQNISIATGQSTPLSIGINGVVGIDAGTGNVTLNAPNADITATDSLIATNLNVTGKSINLPDAEVSSLSAATSGGSIAITVPTSLEIDNLGGGAGISAGTGGVTLLSGGAITQAAGTAGSILAGDLIVDPATAGMDITLTNPANTVTGTVQLLGPDNVSFTNSTDTILGDSVAGGSLTVVSAGSITIAAGTELVVGSTGDALILSAAHNFINNSGAAAVLLPAGGRFLIYSAAPSGDVFGGLDSSNTAIWDTSYPTAITATGSRYVFALQPALTATAGNLSKVYGTDDTTAVSADVTLGGLQSGVAGAYLADSSASVFNGTLSATSTGSAAGASVAGGPYPIIFSGSLVVSDGYSLSEQTGLLTVTPAPLTLSLTGTVSKVFDGSTAATLSSANYSALSGILSGDTVSVASLPTSGTYDSAAVGTGKTVTVTGLTLSGAQAADYSLTGSLSGAIGVITAADSGGNTPPPVNPPPTTPPTTTPVLISVIVSNQTVPTPPLQTNNLVFDTLTTPVTPNGLPLQTIPTAPTPPTPSNPIANMVADGSQSAPTEDSSPSDQTTDYVVQSFEGGPPPGAKAYHAGNFMIIPGLLHASPGKTPGDTGDTGDLSAWGNIALWQ
jgi:filamentous hemagglutinin family protein